MNLIVRLAAIAFICLGPGVAAAAVCALILWLVGLDRSVIEAASAVAFLCGSILGSCALLFQVLK